MNLSRNKKSKIYNPPIVMAEAHWKESPLSVARFTGGVNCFGNDYIVCDKRGRDIYECSREAEKQGRAMAIEPGEPCDLVIRDWLPVYRAVGREKFLEIVEQTCGDLAEAKEMAGIGRKK